MYTQLSTDIEMIVAISDHSTVSGTPVDFYGNTLFSDIRMIKLITAIPY